MIIRSRAWNSAPPCCWAVTSKNEPKGSLVSPSLAGYLRAWALTLHSVKVSTFLFIHFSAVCHCNWHDQVKNHQTNMVFVCSWAGWRRGLHPVVFVPVRWSSLRGPPDKTVCKSYFFSMAAEEWLIIQVRWVGWHHPSFLQLHVCKRKR